eukprot:154341-Rhodomonas_salina.1
MSATSLRNVRYQPTQCGTDGAYVATGGEGRVGRWPSVARRPGMLCPYATPTRCPVLTQHTMEFPVTAPPKKGAEWAGPGMALRACYAMSSTAIAYAAICLRACYAMSGTLKVYAAMMSHAMSGTEI